jgi:protein tyrosine phosphatase (PTP) superfamily phosphohydrolase (DUF442 family)
MLFRPGEVSCITHTPDSEEPFDLATAHLQPTLIEADNIEDAALTVSKQILAVGDRILASQVDEADQTAGCCGRPDACEHGQPSSDCVAAPQPDEQA